MTNQRGLLVAYYLSKYNRQALANLNYPNFSVAFSDIGGRLGIKPNSVKNMRDEFDPLHGHRSGWHQRELRPSRAAVVRAFGSLPEETLRGIVLEALGSPVSSPSQIDDILTALQSRQPTSPGKAEALTRGITGKKAEEYFRKQVLNGRLYQPFQGTLIDCGTAARGMTLS